MKINFNKYQGTGNDFIIIDNHSKHSIPSNEIIKRLCDRKFGIGADGLIIIAEEEGYDYRMIYFNSDGNESSMCGNGGRCAAAFCLAKGIAGNSQTFIAPDGIHKAHVDGTIVKLSMKDVREPEIVDNNYFLNTGSPHYVMFRNNVADIDVNNEGKRIRNSDLFHPQGTNVNFVESRTNSIFVRTFERGVEAETLSCGTGVTASAIAAVYSRQFDMNSMNVITPGGELNVSFKYINRTFTDIWLSGPATFVYEGSIEI